MIEGSGLPAGLEIEEVKKLSKENEPDELMTEIVPGVSKLSDNQLEEVAGGNNPSPNTLQICVSCQVGGCGWDTGWIALSGGSDLSPSDTIRSLMAMHEKTKGHHDFRKEYK